LDYGLYTYIHNYIIPAALGWTTKYGDGKIREGYRFIDPTGDWLGIRLA
jgi:hypothetical protein